MKTYLITFITAIYCYSATAQNVSVQRNISFKFIDGDSTRLSFNEEFNLIEDSCSQVYRYAHIDVEQKIYTGPFKDVSHADPKLIITQGAYTAKGLKDGPFIINYVNGTLQAKGNFKNGYFDGRWQVFYDTGKPKITFEANGRDIKIIDEWDAKGVKTVDNGNGVYRADMGFMYWKGKLVNGKPDGKWKSKKASDDSDFTSEIYKKGEFEKGVTSFNEYTDAPRMVLISPTIFAFTAAERFMISEHPCDGAKSKLITHAHYIGGETSFSEHIAEITSDYFKNIDIKAYDETLKLDGEIDERGDITKLQTHDPFNVNVSHGLIARLRYLPKLIPAMIDGKPVKEGFTITYVFHSGSYRFTYRFEPVSAN